VGTIQATEAIKLLLGIGKPLIGELLLVDALEMSFRRVKIRKDPECPACGTRTIRELVEEEVACEVPAPSSVSDITVAELAAARRRGESPFLLDVREPHEWAIGRIEGAEVIPLGELGRELDRLPRDREIVVYCKGGTRSTQGARQLAEAGFPRVSNLLGGILAWSREVDPTIPRY
jgi:adenylyltransferase/sulfurtransferase